MSDSYSIRLLEEMVGIPSPSGEEGKLGGFLARELAQLGFAVERQEVEPGRENVYGIHRFSDDGPLLMFYGHLDTVPPCTGWESDPFQPLREGNRLFGLGACDMKGGIAAIFASLKELLASGQSLHGAVAFAGIVDEEAYATGAQAFLTRPPFWPSAIIAGEPDFGDQATPIPLGMTGKVLYEIEVMGRAAHGFHPDEGINAIDEAVRILTTLDQLVLPRHPRFGQGSLCTLKIEGGYRQYSVVVPDRCIIVINRLLVPGESSEKAVQELEALIASLELRAETVVRLLPPQYEPFMMEADEHIVSIFTDAYQAVMQHPPHFSYQTTVADANMFAGSGGIPTLNFGPKGGGHAPGQRIRVCGDAAPGHGGIYATGCAVLAGKVRRIRIGP